LRNISIMMALVNFFASSVNTQLVLFASERLGAGVDSDRHPFLRSTPLAWSSFPCVPVSFASGGRSARSPLAA